MGRAEDRKGWERFLDRLYAVAYDSGYADGFRDGFAKGRRARAESSYRRGLRDGELHGYQLGFEAGYAEGKRDADSLFEQGWQQGYASALAEKREGDGC